MPFFHGINISEPVDGVRPILEKSTAVIGLVATAGAAAGAATAALDDAFPLNKPVLVNNVRRVLAVAGNTGTLAPSLKAIADQGSPLIVVVRVAAGANATETRDNILGTEGDGTLTGIYALLSAEARLGVRPRIIGVPGFDSLAVVTALLPVAKRLRAFVYAACRDQAVQAATRAAALIHRAKFAERELELIWPDWSDWDGSAVARALGLRAMLDETVGWHTSLSNVPVAGVTGMSKDLFFDMRDPSTPVGLLNAGQVTSLVRTTGYRYWGNRTCASEPFFAFEVATRTAQAIQDVIADETKVFVDKPMTVALVRDVVETINATLRRWRTEDRIIGGECWYDGDANPAEALAAGRLAIDYDYTPVAPLEGLSLNQRITDRYYADFGDALNGAQFA